MNFYILIETKKNFYTFSSSQEPSFRVLLRFCSSVLFYNLFQRDFAHKECVTL